MDSNHVRFVLLFMLGYQIEAYSAQARICHGDVRLVNGSGPYEGRLEIFLIDTWKTVCDFYLYSYLHGHPSVTNQIASVVCGQLGYSREDAVAFGGGAFGQGSGSIVEDIFCYGLERKLIDCYYHDYNDWFCHHGEDVSVRCFSCQHEGELRLQGNTSQLEGFVEVCFNGTWGTVCASNWDSTDVGVVCKQLGFSRFGSSAWYIYHQLSWPVHLGDIQCTGDEQDLIDCSRVNMTSQNCSSWHAGVTCQQILHCREGELRITDGTVENEGTVEMCFNEVWGRVCSSNWDQQDATVVCRQLGYSEHGARVRSEFEVGNETNIVCQYDISTYNSCIHSQYVGVYCNLDTAPAPLDFQVKLDKFNNYAFNWQPPVIAKRHGNILEYFVTCSSQSLDEQTLNTSTNDIDVLLLLRPHATYNCCVFTINEIGLGDPACQTIVTYEAAPGAPPTSINGHSLINSMSTFLSWKPPLPQYRNGIIQGYQVEVLKVNTTTGFNYTTEDPYLLINDLEQDALYTCRVAAFTVGMGPFSEIFTITKKKEDTFSPLMLALATTSGLLTFLLIISIIMLITVCLCCRKHKPQMKNMELNLCQNSTAII